VNNSPNLWKTLVGRRPFAGRHRVAIDPGDATTVHRVTQGDRHLVIEMVLVASCAAV
jgi:hypothetical protein